MRILAVGAHPDDLEILCAGTLAKYCSRGDVVFMCHVADGDKGHFVIPPDELTRIRAQEACAAANVIGAECVAMNFRDVQIYDTPEARERFIDMVRATRPDVVITHHTDDYHTDHKLTSALTLDATFSATVPHIKTAHEYLPKLPAVYFMDTLAGINFQPTEYVDITDFMPQKREMLSKHASQLVWLREHDAYDALDALETMAKFRGYQCGVRYAEGFIRYRVWGRNQPGCFLP
jgi:LmbE family N-acetylglucosaminyl deacetylase